MLEDCRQIDAASFQFAEISFKSFFNVRMWTHWSDVLGVHIIVTLGIVFFDMLEVGRLLET